MSNTSGSKWCRPEKRLAIYSRDAFRCVYCARTADEDGVVLSLDHVLPRELGGSNASSNLVTACVRCNSRRQDTPLKAWILTLVDAGRDVESVTREVRSATRRKVDMAEGKRLLAVRKAGRAVVADVAAPAVAAVEETL
jgi:hypothetical protein